MGFCGAGAALRSPPRCRHVSEISAHFLIPLAREKVLFLALPS